MKIVVEDFAFLPTRAHPTDAGLDLYAPFFCLIPAHGSISIDTGIHIELPENTAGLLISKSGLNVKHGITSEGCIDVGYTGSITVKLYNRSEEDYSVERGDKISQLLVIPILTPGVEVTDKLSPTERGNGGFGSTGR